MSRGDQNGYPAVSVTAEKIIYVNQRLDARLARGGSRDIDAAAVPGPGREGYTAPLRLRASRSSKAKLHKLAAVHIMVEVPRPQSKGFDAPDEVRRFPNGVVKLVTLGETGVAHFMLRPGWRWSTDVAPTAGTGSCQLRHVGHVIAGTLAIRMDDGTEMTIGPGRVYEIPPGHDSWVVGDESFEAIEFASASAYDYGRSAEALGERVLSTILFSDIVDSTATLERLGDSAWVKVLREHNERIRRVIDRYHGREVTTLGDGFLALFDGATRAASAAAEIDAAVSELGLRVRVGLHTGEVEVSSGQARGVAVHAAARVAALAGPGEVLVSGTTRDLLDGSGFDFDSRGEHELKGLSGSRPIFALKI